MARLQIIVTRVTTSGLEPEDRASVLVIARGALSSTAVWPFVHAEKITHTHRGGGFYTATIPTQEPGAGEWLLAVFAESKSPVVQRLTLTEVNGVLRATPGWKGEQGTENERTAATVSIVNFNQQSAGGTSLTAITTQITVRGIDIKQAVMVAGHDSASKGTNFRLFAEGRRNLLFKARVLDEGSIVHMLVCDSRKTQIQVKSRANSYKHWLVVGEHVKAPPSQPRPNPSDELGILDFYRLLHDIGKTDTGSVVEAGIFGHGWYGGPIIWDTNDYEPSLTKRDDSDTDGRQKDWTGDTMTAFPSLRFAFGPNAVLRLWGCAHMAQPAWAARAAQAERRKGTPANELYTARYINGAIERTSLDYQARNIAQYVVSTLLRPMFEHGDQAGVVSYTGAAVQALRIPCFAAPPGMGASFGTLDGNPIMHIIPDQETAPLLEFWQDAFGSDFKTDPVDHYLNYQAILDAKLPNPGWSTERSFRYPEQHEHAVALRVASGLEVFRPIGSAAFPDPTPVTFGGVAGHLFVAPGGKPARVELRDVSTYLFVAPAPEDLGVFVRVDGVVMLMTRPHRGAWAIDTRAVPRVTMAFRGESKHPSWRASDGTPPTFTNGVIHRVTPAYVW